MTMGLTTQTELKNSLNPEEKTKPLFGIIILNKPKGFSSNQVLSQLKKALNFSKMGFLGTLDPLATGVLAVFVGKATRLINQFEGVEKVYQVTMELGARTDTFDSEGEVLEKKDVSHLTEEEVEKAVLAFSGTIEQKVPAFSAIKINGVPAYRLARKGQEVPERIRSVHLSELVVERISLPQVVFRVKSTAGTYMRALVNDIGLALGVGGYMSDLERLACGDLFALSNSTTLVELQNLAKEGRRDFVLNPVPFLTDFQKVQVPEEAINALQHGQTFALEVAEDVNLTVGVKVMGLGGDGELLAIGQTVETPEGMLGFCPNRVFI